VMSQSVTAAHPAEPTVLLRADASRVILQTDEANAMLKTVLDFPAPSLVVATAPLWYPNRSARRDRNVESL